MSPSTTRTWPPSTRCTRSATHSPRRTTDGLRRQVGLDLEEPLDRQSELRGVGEHAFGVRRFVDAEGLQDAVATDHVRVLPLDLREAFKPDLGRVRCDRVEVGTADVADRALEEVSGHAGEYRRSGAMRPDGRIAAIA